MPRLAGYSFLEFAVDDAARRDLALWLGKIGFARAGRHRSKAVTLFRQGSISLVVNAEPDSFARRRFLDERSLRLRDRRCDRRARPRA